MSTQPSPVSIILDIETLHRAPGALITEIALVAFNRKDFVPFHQLVIRPGFYHQIQHGRLICPDTIAYHRKHGTLASSVTDEAPDLTLKKIAQFFQENPPERIWIQGPDFDRPILENFHHQFGAQLPWEYWRIRDTRSVWDVAFPGVKHDPRPHRALADCKATLNDLAKSLIALNRTEAA